MEIGCSDCWAVGNEVITHRTIVAIFHDRLLYCSWLDMYCK